MNSLQYHLEHRHATWLELFFDLVFVASIGIVTHNLAHTHDGHISIEQLLLFPIELIPIWWIWATHTLYANRYDTDSNAHRLATLAIMFLMIAMAAYLGENLLQGFAVFIAFYVIIRLILAGLYLGSSKKHGSSTDFTRAAAVITLTGIGISGLALVFTTPISEAIFLGGITFEMVAMIVLVRRPSAVSVHRSHLVERIGLLVIILLGESVISLVGSLRGIEWNEQNMTAAITGFIMIGCIWWIYFDSFDVLERARRIERGLILLYSQVLFIAGLLILANLIRHSILGDLSMEDFRLLAVSGMILLYLGKQSLYFHALPPYRINILINSTICVAITVAATFLPRPELALMGMTFGMLFYSYSNLRWTLTKDVTEYLVPES